MIDPTKSFDPNDTIEPDDDQDPSKTVHLDETVKISSVDAQEESEGTSSQEPDADAPEEDEYGTIDPDDSVGPIEKPADPFETWEDGAP